MSHAKHSSIATPLRRLRVLQCITRLSLGGAERIAFSLVRGLRHEIDFAVFTVHGAGADAIGAEMRAELAALGVPWFRGTGVPMKAGGMIPGAWALARAIREFQPDVVHFHAEPSEACGAALQQLRFTSRKFGAVRTIHNSVFWRFWPRIGRWCDRKLVNAHVAGVSQSTSEEFQRYRADSGAPSPHGEPTTIYNGIDAALAPVKSAPSKLERRRLLFAGRFEPEKGADVLLRALRKVVLPADVTAELLLVGHGDQEGALRRAAATPPVGWQIVFQPVLPSIWPLLAATDVVVVPSIFEGFGLVAAEAIFAGRPVVMTDAPGLREVLPPEHPWRARPGDADDLAEKLTAALRDTAHWEPAMRTAQAWAATRFTAEQMRRAYAQLYRRASGEPTGGDRS
ncbi:MAG: glycosyltransferase family 4 protein [Candidatus Didemnitutus sp.]|nr:glycosyltransferase family 4 protein [Candidatus Didemnitutus sp.]